MNVDLPTPDGLPEQPDPEHCDVCVSPVPWFLLEHRSLPDPRWVRPPKDDTGRIVCKACQAREAAKALGLRVDARLKRWGIPKKFRQYSWDRSIKQTKGEPFPMFQARVEGQPEPTIGFTHRNVFVALALKAWRPRRGGKWVLVSGPTGSGKTMFSCATARELAGDEVRYERLTLDEMYEQDAAKARQYDPEHGGRYTLPVRRVGGASVVFVQEHALRQAELDWYQRSRQGGRGEQRPMDALYTAGCVILDDIGTADQNDKWKAMISGLVDKRYAAELPTMMTSNMSRIQLEVSYGQRFGSRIAEIADYHELEVNDWRR